MEKLAFDKIYKEYYYPVLDRIRKSINNDTETAKELTDDVFIKVNDHLSVFNPEKAKLITWIFSIAKNTVIDYYRANNKVRQLALTELNDVSETFAINNSAYADMKTDQNYDNNKVRKEIERAMSKLTGNYKTIAELYFLEEKQYNEIAEILNISMSNVKVTILRTRERLQELLANVREMAY
jgi:RNA polymerase sigma-70 factor (ECF subfamily)